MVLVIILHTHQVLGRLRRSRLDDFAQRHIHLSPAKSNLLALLTGIASRIAKLLECLPLDILDPPSLIHI